MFCKSAERRLKSLTFRGTVNEVALVKAAARARNSSEVEKLNSVRSILKPSRRKSRRVFSRAFCSLLSERKRRKAQNTPAAASPVVILHRAFMI